MRLIYFTLYNPCTLNLVRIIGWNKTALQNLYHRYFFKKCIFCLKFTLAIAKRKEDMEGYFNYELTPFIII